MNQHTNRQFVGRTSRGRVVREATLDECINSLAFVMNLDAATLWLHETNERSWVVLPTKSTPEDAWIATIERIS